MCDYKIKHYWDSGSYGATIEPTWITASSSYLNEEQKKIKALVQDRLLPLNNYNRLAKHKPKQEKIDGYTIKYSYKDKDDPDPTNNRKVTDITFCIVVPKESSKSWIYGLIAIFIVFGLYFLFGNSKEIKTENRNLKQPTKVEEKKQPEKVIKKLSLIEEICKSYKKIAKPNKCWMYYYNQLNCDNNITSNKIYLQWFKDYGQEKVEECSLLDENDYFDFNFKDEKYGKNKNLIKLLEAKEFK